MGQGQRRIYGYGEGVWRPVGVDYLTNAVNTVSYGHHKAHDGGFTLLGIIALL